MLAFTNKRVQECNVLIMGRELPIAGDVVYNSTFKRQETVVSIQLATEQSMRGGEFIACDSRTILDDTTKFNPKRTLGTLDNIYIIETDKSTTLCLFGSNINKVYRDRLETELANLNKQNKDSKTAYKKYITLNTYVCNYDFAHCRTIHKSQGSEFTEVFFNASDLIKYCPNPKTRSKLFYTAISRAKFKVIYS